MAYFPFMIQLDDKQCLIVGGGAVAARKAAQMCEFGACVTVVAPEICAELLAIADTERIDETAGIVENMVIARKSRNESGCGSGKSQRQTFPAWTL